MFHLYLWSALRPFVAAVTTFRCFVSGTWFSLLVLWVWLSRREAGELQKAAPESVCRVSWHPCA